MSNRLPELSVAICTHNRCAKLRTVLAALADEQASYLGDRWELLLVENDSPDGTTGVADEFGGRLPLRYFREPKRGTSHARNRALREFRADVVAFLDDDVIPSPGWRTALTAGLARWPAAEVFQGRVLPRWDCPPPKWLCLDPQLKVRGPLPEVDLGEEERLLPSASFVTANAAVRRSAVERAGLFSTDFGAGAPDIPFGEDAAYAHQLRGAGARGAYLPAALVYHPVAPERLTLEHFRRSGRNLGRVHARLRYADRNPSPPLLGLPRHVPREYFEMRCRQLLYRMLRNTQLSFYYACRAWYLEGLISERVLSFLYRTRHRDPAAQP